MPTPVHPRNLVAAALCILLATTAGLAQSLPRIIFIDFNGYSDGTPFRDQFAIRGLRLPLDIAGGPYIENAGLLSFLLDSPPNLLSLSPFEPVGPPGQVHGSRGKYVFNFVDPLNPNVPSRTDFFEVVLIFVDDGMTFLTAYDHDGRIIDQDVLTKLSSSSYLTTHTLSVSMPGIRKVILAPPVYPSSRGALVDTVRYNLPAVIPSRAIPIDVAINSRRNVLRLGSTGNLRVAILSEPGFVPSMLDPQMVLFHRSRPVLFNRVDINRDKVEDLVLHFPYADMRGLNKGRTRAVLTAVGEDGTPLRGADEVVVFSDDGDRDPQARRVSR